MYQIIVFIHVLSAIAAVGYNATYAVWLARGSMEREHLLFALRGIKFMDDRVANPAYGLLLITGIAQVIMSHRSWHETWIELAIVLWVILAVIGFAAYSPTLKREIQLLSERSQDDPEFVALDRRGTVLGATLMIIALVIVGLMVFRPGGA
ncbi:MAG TPA: DUF2269 family protein [Candidatus Baltobacteraceae bacterium]|nr:DUF2269 family protein [Candidatus Baltobacteraceae bacterium]